MRAPVAAIVAFTTLSTAAPFTSGNSGNYLLGSHFGLPGDKTFDYVVVGGGTAGLAVASRLAEDPSNLVAVIEAGSFYEIGNGNLSDIPLFGPAFSGKSPFDIAPLVDWAFLTTPQTGTDNRPAHYARGKCLGGSSARNYLTYQRPSTQSLKQWADAVDDQSYTFDQFVPYFERSLTFTPPDATLRAANATPEYDSSKVGTGKGPLSVTFGHYAQAFSSWAQAAFKQLGINPIQGFTSGRLLGSSYQLLNIDGQHFTRDSSETSFLRKIGLPRDNLIIYQSTLAKRIVFDDNKVATAVEIDIGNLGRATFKLSAKKEVIVSAGAFQSPQLLMVSGVGPAAILQKNGISVVADLPGVGQNMWDHVLGGPSYRVNVLTTSALGNPYFSAQQADLFHADPPRGMLTNSGADMLGFEKIPQTLRDALPAAVKTDLAKFPADWPELEYIPTSAYYGYQNNYIFDAPRDSYNYATIAAVLVAPLSRGTVSISSADMKDPPIINPNWLSSPTDQAVAVAGYKRARALFASSAMKPVLIGSEYFPGGNRTDPEILDIIKKTFSTVFHASCTCKMGKATDQNAVLDSRTRVRGVKNLRVVDASSFPLLPPGHPVATVCELGLFLILPDAQISLYLLLRD
ncbi:MAG: hypothetical protein Q9196_000683 [Gyalolechia fulgens]